MSSRSTPPKRGTLIGLRQIIFCAVLTGSLAACATTDPDRSTSRRGDPTSSIASETGSCKPFFISPMNESPENVPRRSCWNRLWEVPAAIAIAPVAIGVVLGVVTAPIWVPLLLLH